MGDIPAPAKPSKSVDHIDQLFDCLEGKRSCPYTRPETSFKPPILEQTAPGRTGPRPPNPEVAPVVPADRAGAVRPEQQRPPVPAARDGGPPPASVPGEYQLPKTTIHPEPVNKDPDWKRYSGPHPDSDTPGWSSIHKGFSDQVAQARRNGGIDVALYGDSLTDGANKVGDFPGVVSDKLGVKGAAFGIVSDNTEHLRWRMLHGETDFGDHPPKVAAIMIGTNNMADHSKNFPEDDANAVTAIVKTIELAARRMPNTEILALGILPRGDANRMARVADINSRVAKKLAQENLPNVTYADIGKKFLNRDGSRNRDLYAGSVHFNEDGYALLADTIAERVKPLVDRTRRP